MKNFTRYDNLDKVCDVVDCERKATFKNNTGLAFFCDKHMAQWEANNVYDEIVNMQSLGSHRNLRIKKIR